MAQREMPRGIRRDDVVDNDNDVLNNDDFQNLRRAILVPIRIRKRTIQVFRQLAITADVIHRCCSMSNRNANITGAIGGWLGVVAGGIVIFTGGMATPLVIGTCAGGVCSISGGAWCLMNDSERDRRMSDLRGRLREQIAEDNEAVHELENINYRIRNGDFGIPHLIFRLVHISVATFGVAVASNALELALPPISYLLSAGTQYILLSMIPILAAEALNSTGQVAAVKAVCKISAKAAKKAAKKTAKKAAEKTAEKAVTTAAKEGMKTTARVTGAVSVGIGALTTLWEGYNAYQNHYASQEESQLGKELRDLANNMESNAIGLM